MPSKAPIRVVVADDEDAVRALLGIALCMQEDDFEVVGEAHDGIEAVDLVNERHPDAIVLDLMMPVLGGIDAIPKIRECWPPTKIVVFSALDAGQMAAEAVASGADAYVEKTRVVTELAWAIRKVCA